MRRILCALLLSTPGLWAVGDTASQLASRIRPGLDPEHCYRVREISFSREDARIYLTDGYLILGQPIDGRRISAVFSAEVEGGDGELLVMPPLRSERLSLATFTKSPNLSEHFRSAVMLFTDDTADELLELVRKQEPVRPSPEMGIILDRKWGPVVNNLAVSFGNRVVYDLLSKRPASEGFFYSAITGTTHGNFDLIYDPVSPDEIQIGQVRYRDNRPIFDVWTSFPSRSSRRGTKKKVLQRTLLRDYRIEATLERDLMLRAKTRATLAVVEGSHHALFFDISPRIEVTQVLLDGQPCEIWQRDSLRADLLRKTGNGIFLVVPPQPLQQGRAYVLEFHHEGRVVSDAGNNVYYVGSRGTWYPRQGLNFTSFDITFRFPEGLDLVFTGEVLEDRSEGEWHVTRRRTESPIRLAGFNLGSYEHVAVEHPGYRVEVYANRQVEDALEPEKRLMIVPQQPGWPGRRGSRLPNLVAVTAPVQRRDPTARMEPFANEIASAFAFMAEHFGPAPTRTLTVSPIPGSFGQGFPGLLYISTMAYLEPEQRPKEATSEYHEMFYSEILLAHETAHQWWGNIVSTAHYEDDWLMEALANYSALLLLERKKGPEALQAVLEQYREHLLAGDGKTLESAGPICWGPRLNSSQARAWRVITYEKGSWIIHMLRRAMGDEPFLNMLGEFCRRYRFRKIDLEQFRQLATEFLPEGAPDPDLENFIDMWIRGVGIPSLEFTHSVRGRPPRVRVFGSVQQSGVADDFGVDVPVELRFDNGQSLVRWVRSGSEPVPFDVTVRRRPQRVVFNPGDSVLTTKR